ncbi:putative nuclease HARBI1 [Plutella xylostella]|uniref:putative nuclease HARBI1 n=1 Tax=Plutella xylostella TaxID=51655 RepID=UPI002032C4FF|nr:putative nuclease HARBI1 [Plutella xylostella]
MARAFLLAEAEEERQAAELNILRRRLRDMSNPMELPEDEFVGQFRLTKHIFAMVLTEITPILPPVERVTAVRNELKLLAALSFYAHGSYQKTAGASHWHCMSQPTFSKCLDEVTLALNNINILKKFIKFPSTEGERELLMRRFMEKFHFPGVLGCIDGTHVAIIRPKEHEETFLNRKNYHSLNVLIICDADLNIMHLDAAFGGAAHDSFVWNQSPIKTLMEDLNRNGSVCWFLGDSGYALRPWMLTPILNAAVGSPEEHYTDMHCHVRNTVERCIGVLKARWRCLLAHRVLHYEPTKAAKIVNACCVLHNIANAHNLPVPDDLPAAGDIRQQHNNIGNVANGAADADAGRMRANLVQRLWISRNP